MVQVLKDDVKNRIFEAALNEFYKKDFKSANLRSIANEADVSVGLIYSYFNNKEDLFDEIVKPAINISFENFNYKNTDPYNVFINFERDMILELLDNHKIFVILADKSSGTKYEEYKEQLVENLTIHISENIDKSHFNNKLESDDVFIHILANTFIEGILEIARHYKGKKWAESMLDLFAEYYYNGFK
ncbi:TetR/AcrR family transcriptional regulator [Methanobrevibacter sp. V74]|uniref:TetR/AcrR family transcriptional regulator n=1 Tax=Methanobrevibacter sp. V74 TaxID=3064279 RepID=UPI00273576CE|nr:TetR/AcrR family transcriptional regulator [Methanobrevibacter sp. V74]